MVRTGAKDTGEGKLNSQFRFSGGSDSYLVTEGFLFLVRVIFTSSVPDFSLQVSGHPGTADIDRSETMDRVTYGSDSFG